MLQMPISGALTIVTWPPTYQHGVRRTSWCYKSESRLGNRRPGEELGQRDILCLGEGSQEASSPPLRAGREIEISSLSKNARETQI